MSKETNLLYTPTILRSVRYDVCELFVQRTVGSVAWASGCPAGGCEFDSGRTNTQGLKITE